MIPAHIWDKRLEDMIMANENRIRLLESEVMDLKNNLQNIQKQMHMCPTCKQPLTFIEKHQKWYCYPCQRYE
jgi:hypothetical protein